MVLKAANAIPDRQLVLAMAQMAENSGRKWALAVPDRDSSGQSGQRLVLAMALAMALRSALVAVSSTKVALGISQVQALL